MKNKRLVTSVICLIFAVFGTSIASVAHHYTNNVPETRPVPSITVNADSYTYKIPDVQYDTESYTEYSFRTKSTLNEHYKKHKADTHTSSKQEYVYRANYVINNDDSLKKTEKEDGDYVYYLVETNELVILSKDGYIRTYFCPDNGKKYFDKQ